MYRSGLGLTFSYSPAIAAAAATYPQLFSSGQTETSAAAAPWSTRSLLFLAGFFLLLGLALGRSR